MKDLKKMVHKASDILAGRVSIIAATKNIQSNFGHWPGYIGEQPIAFSAKDVFLFPTGQRLVGTMENPVTEYDGIWVKNDVDDDLQTCFKRICEAYNILYVPA